MTLFAGIFSRNEHHPIPDSVCDGLRRDVTRNKPDEVRTFRDNRCCLLKVDIGAFEKLCMRPLYYWADDQSVVFATALRILEGNDAVPKVMDLQGVTEMCGLGYPLGSRTHYAEAYLRREHSSATSIMSYRLHGIIILIGS